MARLPRGGFEFAGGEALAKVVEEAGEEIERGGEDLAVGEDDAHQ
jgi:hypothetical protein